MTKMIIENMGGNVMVENTCEGVRVTLCVPKVSAAVLTELVTLPYGQI